MAEKTMEEIEAELVEATAAAKKVLGKTVPFPQPIPGKEPKLIPLRKVEPVEVGAIKEAAERLMPVPEVPVIEQKERELAREVEKLDIDLGDLKRQPKSFDPNANCSVFDSFLDDAFSQVPDAGEGICNIVRNMESDTKVRIATVLQKWEKEDREMILPNGSPNPEFIPMDRNNDIRVLRNLTNKVKMYENISQFCTTYKDKPGLRGDGSYDFSLCQELTAPAIPAIMYNLFTKSGLEKAGMNKNFWETFFDKYPVYQWYSPSNRYEDAGLWYFKNFGDKKDIVLSEAFSDVEQFFVENSTEGPRIKSFLTFLPQTMAKFGMGEEYLDRRGKKVYSSNLKQLKEAYFGVPGAGLETKKISVPLKTLKGLKGIKEDAGTWKNAVLTFYHNALMKKLIHPDTEKAWTKELPNHPEWFGLLFDTFWSKVDPAVLNDQQFQEKSAEILPQIFETIGYTNYLIEPAWYTEGRDIVKSILSESDKEELKAIFVPDEDKITIKDAKGLPIEVKVVNYFPDEQKVIEFFNKKAEEFPIGIGSKKPVTDPAKAIGMLNRALKMIKSDVTTETEQVVEAMLYEETVAEPTKGEFVIRDKDALHTIAKGRRQPLIPKLPDDVTRIDPKKIYYKAIVKSKLLPQNVFRELVSSERKSELKTELDREITATKPKREVDRIKLINKLAEEFVAVERSKILEESNISLETKQLSYLKDYLKGDRDKAGKEITDLITLLYNPDPTFTEGIKTVPAEVLQRNFRNLIKEFLLHKGKLGDLKMITAQPSIESKGFPYSRDFVKLIVDTSNEVGDILRKTVYGLTKTDVFNMKEDIREEKAKEKGKAFKRKTVKPKRLPEEKEKLSEIVELVLEHGKPPYETIPGFRNIIRPKIIELYGNYRKDIYAKAKKEAAMTDYTKTAIAVVAEEEKPTNATKLPSMFKSPIIKKSLIGLDAQALRRRAEDLIGKPLTDNQFTALKKLVKLK